MGLIYRIVRDFGWAVVIFTILVKLASFPLTLKQQKNMAVSQLFTPRVQEIQKKYRGNQAKMQEEMQKLQKEGYNPVGGCGPMILTMIILFGVIDVVYKPMTHMERFGRDAITEIVSISKQVEFTSIVLASEEDAALFVEFSGSGEDFHAFFRRGDEKPRAEFTATADAIPETGITNAQRQQIGALISANFDTFTGVDSRLSDSVRRSLTSANNGYVRLRQELRAVAQFEHSPQAFETLRSVPIRQNSSVMIYGQLEKLQENMMFLGFINLGAIPQYTVFNSLWIIGILCFVFSVVQMAVQRFIQKRTMPDMPNSGMMRGMMLMGPMFSLIIVFTVPAGAGLYWAISYMFMIAQSVFIYKFHPPERMRAEAAERVKAQGTITAVAKVVDVDDSGNEVVTETKVAEMSKREQEEYFKKKLEAARKADLEKYGETPDIDLSEYDNKKLKPLEDIELPSDDDDNDIIGPLVSQ
jgi:YidC/Oxa1 family membrane protein insertase